MNKRILLTAAIATTLAGTGLYLHSAGAAQHNDAATSTTSQTSPLIQDGVPTTPTQAAQTPGAPQTDQTTTQTPLSGSSAPVAPTDPAPAPNQAPSQSQAPAQPAPTLPENPNPGDYMCPPVANQSTSCTSSGAIGQ